MARRPFLLQSNNPYHVTARCINRDWFSLDMHFVWRIMEDYLFLAAQGFQLKIHAFVLMRNHFHLLVSNPEGNLSVAMQYFMRETSRWLTRESGRVNQAWGGRFHRCEIQSYHYYLNAYKYVYRNPIHARAISRAEDYPFSTLNGLLGHSRLVIPIEQDLILFDGDLDGALKWINKTPRSEHYDAVRKAFRRRVFGFPSTHSRPHDLEVELL